jgi:hypothetical protein
MTESKSIALTRFLVDPDLEKLSARLTSFNIFQALKVEKKELQHSNTLGWLLNPGASHGLGDLVLKRMLSSILLERDIASISSAHVELMDFSDVEVRREWKSIDIFIIIKSINFVLLIENKIHAEEGPEQLARYVRVVEKEFSSFTLVPIFLTLDGRGSENTDAGFISYSHRQLLELLTLIIETRKPQITPAVAMFLDHYLDTLRRLTMQDKELIELCKNIYRKHKEAIDQIVEYRKISEFPRIVVPMLEKENFEVLYQNSSHITFIPKTWVKIVPLNGSYWGDFDGLGRSLSVVCSLYKNGDSKLSLVAEVSSMTDSKLRRRCMERLRNDGFKFRDRAFDETAKSTVFISFTETISDFNDEEELKIIIVRLLEKAGEPFRLAEVAMSDVFKQK